MKKKRINQVGYIQCVWFWGLLYYGVRVAPKPFHEVGMEVRWFKALNWRFIGGRPRLFGRGTVKGVASNVLKQLSQRQRRAAHRAALVLLHVLFVPVLAVWLAFQTLWILVRLLWRVSVYVTVSTWRIGYKNFGWSNDYTLATVILWQVVAVVFGLMWWFK